IYDANPDGCSHCVKGRKGRAPIFEIFTLGPKERLAIEHGKLGDLAALVRAQPCYRPLAASAFGLVASGLASFADAQSVVGTDVIS
ncbi:MAG: hypothetical protein ACK4SA_25785, partial [Caldilinea sp.]